MSTPLPRRPVLTLRGMVLWGAALLLSHAASAAPLETYGRLPALENVAVSPDGQKLAFARTDGDVRIVGVIDPATGKFISGVQAGNAKLRGLRWADNRMLLIFTSTTARVFGLGGKRREYSMLSLLDTQTNRVTPLPRPMPRENMMNTTHGTTMVRHIGGQTVLYIPGIHITDRTLPALFRFNLATGEQQLFFRGNEATQDWFIDEAGNLAALVDYREKTRTWSVRLQTGGKLEQVSAGQSDISIPTIDGFGISGEHMLLSSASEDSPAWEVYALSEAGKKAQLPPLEGFEVPIVDPLSSYLIGGSHTEDSQEYSFVDPDIQRRWDAILALFPGERVLLESISAGFAKVAVRVDGPKHGLAYFLVDTKTNAAAPLGAVQEGITQAFETRAISYAAADGLQIPAYLTLPSKPASKLPLIVLPHGGPAARDTADFDWWAQALASEGYAVLRPNFRGSALGWAHLSAGFGEWGRKMQTDLSDGVRYLAKEGVIDPARVCIVGASYGGYAALAGVTLDPGVYRCAVSVAGLADLPAMLKWVDENYPYGQNTTERYWNRFMGSTDRKDPVLRTISPGLLADRVTVPVMLIHGKDDTVVPFEQSNIMMKALKRAGKNAQLVTLEKEDHWLSRGETRTRMLQESVAFLRANNPPD
jgi:dienelactone hydrolase